MGFFSWNCRGCGHPMLSDFSATPGVNAWMKDVVIIEESGRRLEGRYDGHGRVDGEDIDWERGQPECWHRACWLHAGRPDVYTGASTRSDDQGYFFEEGAHDMGPPGGVTDNTELEHHECEDGWREYDAQGIYLCRVCDLCREAKLSRYRPEILTGYTQADVDEPIEED